MTPPELAGAVRLPSGGFELTGRASPATRVRLATPGGSARFAIADQQGIWRLSLPAFAEPRLLGLSMSDDGRVVQAQGYLFLAPDGAVARLRAGGGGEAPGPAPAGLAATALDYDKVLAATVSGRAGPGETVTLRVDGIQRGQAGADAGGRFVLPLNQPLTDGPHDFALYAASGEAHLSASITPPEPLAGVPFRASRTPVGWRVDWLTPGGGEQTTLLIDVAEAVH